MKRLLLLMILSACGSGSGTNTNSPTVFDKTTCTDTTKNVLIIGDKVSIDYSWIVSTELIKEFYVQHSISSDIDGYADYNAKDTTKTIENISDYLSDCPHWDLITWNNGFHDILGQGSISNGVALTEYENNLKTIAARLEKTGAKVIFFSTTPLETNDPYWNSLDVNRWNTVARETLRFTNVIFYDLNAWAHKAAEYQEYDNWTYTDAGNKHNAQFVIDAIREEMK